MTNEAGGGQSAEDREVIRLAKARLIRICRLDGATAERSLARAAQEQRVALVSVAMRVLSASPEDLAAGRILQAGEGRRPAGPQQRRPPHKGPPGKQRAQGQHKRPFGKPPQGRGRRAGH
jgi:hypothetical protein